MKIEGKDVKKPATRRVECNLGESVILREGREENRVLSEKSHCQRPLERHQISCLETNAAPHYCQQQEKPTSVIIQATTAVFLSGLNGRSKEKRLFMLCGLQGVSLPSAQGLQAPCFCIWMVTSHGKLCVLKFRG